MYTYSVYIIVLAITLNDIILAQINIFVYRTQEIILSLKLNFKQKWI